jgi:hypothetical protein
VRVVARVVPLCAVNKKSRTRRRCGRAVEDEVARDDGETGSPPQHSVGMFVADLFKSRCRRRIASIGPDDAMILPHDANPGRDAILGKDKGTVAVSKAVPPLA